MKCQDCGCELEIEQEEDLNKTDLRCQKCWDKMKSEVDLEEKEQTVKNK